VMAVRFGIPGFATVALGYIIATARIMRRDFSTDPMLTLFRRAWVFTFLGLSFTMCTVHIWTSIYSFVFFMFGAGAWLITAKSETALLPAATPKPRPAQHLHKTNTKSVIPDVAQLTKKTGPGSHGPRYTRFPVSKDPTQ
jgi:hypothetical protein